MPIDDVVRQNTGDIRALDGRVGKIEVMHGRLFERVEGFVEMSKTQHQATQTGIDEIKATLAVSQREALEYRKSKEALETEERAALFAIQKARLEDEADRREERQKWWGWIRSTLDGKNIMVIVLIVAAIYAPGALSQVQAFFAPADAQPAPAAIP